MCLPDFIKKELNACSRGSCDIATIICAQCFFLRILKIDLTKDNGIKNLVPGISAWLSNVIRALLIIIVCTTILLNSLVCLIIGKYFSSLNSNCATNLLTWMIICGSFGLAFNFLIILFVILKITCCPEDNHFIFSALYAYTIGFAIFAGFITITYGFSWIGDVKKSAECFPGLTYYALASYSIICFCAFVLFCYGAVVYCRYRCRKEPDEQTYHGASQNNYPLSDVPVSIVYNNRAKV
ncbi:unnamed protein product [Adineta ricciae]|uniref:Uncharacterized protein n=1 Tax=Adineta ricciae TaxID=249248 RepID=A0A816D537_ADIRI|nr:unnamed protein product [Adineta ricciae]